MGNPLSLIGRHWRGQLGILISLIGPVFLCHLLAFWVLNAVPVQFRLVVAVAVLPALLIWQVVGLFRTIDRAIGAAPGAVIAVAGYGSIAVLFAATSFRTMDTLTPDWTSTTQPPASPKRGQPIQRCH